MKILGSLLTPIRSVWKYAMNIKDYKKAIKRFNDKNDKILSMKELKEKLKSEVNK